MKHIVKFEQSAHWYDCRTSGLTADQRAQHDADLRVARKKLLYPSITTILKDEFKNEFLEKWKTNELLLAAAGYQRQPHDTDESYCQNIYDISLEKAATAANFGKEIHDAIEFYQVRPTKPEIQAWVDNFSEWYNLNVDSAIQREAILFDHELGLAGRCDFIGRGKGALQDKLIVPDWKTQNVKKDEKGRKKPVFYDSWPRQLAFYAISYAKQTIGRTPTREEVPTCISVIIDSNEACPPFVKVWETEEILIAYEDVLIAAYRWFKRKKYWPQPAGPFKVGFSLDLPQ